MEASVAIALRGVLPDRAAVEARLRDGWAAGPGPEGRAREAALLRARRTGALIDRALAIAAESFAPVGLWRELSAAEFAAVYAGEGGSAPRSPLAEIHPRAAHRALFAVTLGPEVGERVALLFAAREFAMAAALDAAASLGAEAAADRLEEAYRARLETRGDPVAGMRFLRYSPGYCGWHMSGQRALFAALRPERIGVRLRASQLMEPLKSVSGVILAGPAEIHDHAGDYPFCGDCRTRECRERIDRLLGAREGGKRFDGDGAG
ncbi:MAG: hypothetical protein FJY75_11540, partial [Candidatus Eisenbacteria bacterium]|nr:hypothetical protein [Candidatus Eisenbacteria bacterium]